MERFLPGTTLGLDDEAGSPEMRIKSLFLAGGLTLSQVASVTGLEPYTVQNWVKRGFLSPPQKKRYTLEQLCRLININLLRGILPLEESLHLMVYLNGDLADESDDLVADSQLYFLFVSLFGQVRSPEDLNDALDRLTADYSDPGTREKLRQVLRVMDLCWAANCLRAKAETIMQTL